MPQRSIRADALALHDRLLADGWQPGWLALDGVVTGYGDDRATFPQPGHGPADLPAATCTRGGPALQVDRLSDGGGRVLPAAADEVAWSPAPPVVPGLAVAPHGAGGALLRLRPTTPTSRRRGTPPRGSPTHP